MLKFAKDLYQKISNFVDRIYWKTEVDFSRWADNEELSIDVEKGNQYQPSFNNISKVLKKIQINKNDCIIDIGCGKGKAMAVMRKYPFESVAGFDLSDEMVRVANSNFAKLKLENCKAFNADAYTYSDYSKYKYIYMFNAVPLEVFKKTIDNIILDKMIGNSFYFIYLNPMYHSLMLERGFKIVFVQNSIINWKKIIVYKFTKE